jgi:phage terminase large subunit-like protein
LAGRIVSEALSHSTLERWRRDPAAFVAEVIINPETGAPFELLDAERRFLEHAFKTDADGRLLYPEQIYSGPKKTGKTTFAAITTIVAVLVYGGRHAEGYCLANDEEQAVGRVFAAIRRIVAASPDLRREANVMASKIEFRATGATITAIASDYTGAAGANPTISTFDELWGYTSERSRRLWDEMIPSPARKVSLRFTTTYAGYEGESALLEEIYKRGLGQPQVGTDLHAGDGLLMFWTHDPVAPWQTEGWLAEMRRSMRPNAYLRMIENRFVTTESSFIDMAWFDACVDPNATAMVSKPMLPVYVAIDASFKHDSTAIVVVHWDKAADKARLIWHRIFQPSPDEPLDFEATIEKTVRELNRRFTIKKVAFDPWQMQATAQRLRSSGIPIEEFPQSSPRLTEASQNLYELIKSRNIVLYPDADIRRAMGHAIARETSRGWHIAKEKQSHKIDVVVALGMAALIAAQYGARENMEAAFGSYMSGRVVMLNTKQAHRWDGETPDYPGAIVTARR